MGHTPYGYTITNGIAVIDETAATRIRCLYKNYLAGMSLTDAAKMQVLKPIMVLPKDYLPTHITLAMNSIQLSLIKIHLHLPRKNFVNAQIN